VDNWGLEGTTDRGARSTATTPAWSGLVRCLPLPRTSVPAPFVITDDAEEVPACTAQSMTCAQQFASHSPRSPMKRNLSRIWRSGRSFVAPYVLLSPCRSDIEVVILGFCSTRNTQAVLGAPSIEIRRGSKLFDANGLNETTYVYPSRLVSAEQADLIPAGKIIDECSELCDQVMRAVGIGTGTYQSGAAKGSWRGLILELNEEGRGLIQSQYAVVASDPEYSKQAEFFNVIPIGSTDEIYHNGPDVLFQPQIPWVNQLHWGAVIAEIRHVTSVHHSDIVSIRQIPADARSMEQLDDALQSWFSGW
jgi:hypothetical protein